MKSLRVILRQHIVLKLLQGPRIRATGRLFDISGHLPEKKREHLKKKIKDLK